MRLPRSFVPPPLLSKNPQKLLQGEDYLVSWRLGCTSFTASEGASYCSSNGIHPSPQEPTLKENLTCMLVGTLSFLISSTFSLSPAIQFHSALFIYFYLAAILSAIHFHSAVIFLGQNYIFLLSPVLEVLVNSNSSHFKYYPH